MAEKILVAYASKNGATKEIAEKIGEVLLQAGLQADVSPVDGVRDLTPYRAVILGSALYIGKWQKEAVGFMQANEKGLAERPVWLFSSGPTGKGDPVALLKGERLPAAVRPLADRIHPREAAVFHGNIDPGKVNFIEKWVIQKLLKAPLGDFRDWDMICGWASTVAETLK
jgi:menaquinone-dependent protoporphyrinogen oxidase